MRLALPKFQIPLLELVSCSDPGPGLGSVSLERDSPRSCGEAGRRADPAWIGRVGPLSRLSCQVRGPRTATRECRRHLAVPRGATPPDCMCLSPLVNIPNSFKEIVRLHPPTPQTQQSHLEAFAPHKREMSAQRRTGTHVPSCFAHNRRKGNESGSSPDVYQS